MINIFKTYIVLIFFCSILCSSKAWSEEWKAEGWTKENAEKALQYLEQMTWNPWGGQSDGKAVYLLGGNTCGFTKKLINELFDKEELLKEVQFRVIFPKSQYSLPGVEFFMNEPLPQAFIEASQGKRIQATPLQTAEGEMNKALEIGFEKIFGTGVGYPAMFYMNNDGLQFVRSLKSIEADLPNIKPLPDKREQAKAMVQKLASTKRGKYIKPDNKTKNDWPSYTLPSEDAPNLDYLNYGLPAKHWSDNACYEYDGKFISCNGKGGLVYYLKIK